MVVIAAAAAVLLLLLPPAGDGWNVPVLSMVLLEVCVSSTCLLANAGCL